MLMYKYDADADLKTNVYIEASIADGPRWKE